MCHLLIEEAVPPSDLAATTPDALPPTATPPAGSFRHVSSKLATARLVVVGALAAVALVVLFVAGAVFDVPPGLIGAVLIVLLVLMAWAGIVVIRQVPALGYQCRPDDLLIERGIMFRRSTLVPYGRMQFIEVTQGPIARWFGLATVELHTAAALSQASIDGLPRAEADELRDLLADRGESDLAGL